MLHFFLYNKTFSLLYKAVLSIVGQLQFFGGFPFHGAKMIFI